MADAAERLVNLALYLAAAREPVSAARVRADVEGYPADQDAEAFLRMFERDKDELRAAGLAIQADPEGRYLLDTDQTYSAEVELSAAEFAAVRAAVAALAEDPGFPFAADLRLALAKIVTAGDAPGAPARARLADEMPEQQGRVVADLAIALSSSKRVTFTYTNSLARTAAREVEPLGLFAREGRWYLVARDTAADDIRTFALARMADVSVNTSRPKSPDFERPADFDVSSYIRLPFQFGTDSVSAAVRFGSDTAWRAPGLAAGQGRLVPQPDGSVLWSIQARDGRRLQRWVVENGPGIALEAPASLAGDAQARLREVASLHG
ncbi:MAG: WYL domain-containing protein [Actinomycetota bacterium]|nr:WYL domain-containing protein [Actinomycetota bacterium]